MSDRVRQSGEDGHFWQPRAVGSEFGDDLVSPRGGSRPAVVDESADGTRRVTFVDENEFSKNFVRAFARSRAPSEDVASGGNEADNWRDVVSSTEWQGLGRDLDFAPIADDLALIIAGRSDFVCTDDLAARVETLVSALASLGREHAAVAVVAAGLTHADEERLFEAGAQTVGVERDFFNLSDDERLAFLRSKLHDFDDSKQCIPSAAEDPDADPDAYDSVNPDLSKDEIEGWVKRLGST